MRIVPAIGIRSQGYSRAVGLLAVAAALATIGAALAASYGRISYRATYGLAGVSGSLLLVTCLGCVSRRPSNEPRRQPADTAEIARDLSMAGQEPEHRLTYNVDVPGIERLDGAKPLTQRVVESLETHSIWVQCGGQVYYEVDEIVEGQLMAYGIDGEELRFPLDTTQPMVFMMFRRQDRLGIAPRPSWVDEPNSTNQPQSLSQVVGAVEPERCVVYHYGEEMEETEGLGCPVSRTDNWANILKDVSAAQEKNHRIFVSAPGTFFFELTSINETGLLATWLAETLVRQTDEPLTFVCIAPKEPE